MTNLDEMIRDANWEVIRLLQRGESADKVRAVRLWSNELWKAALIVRNYRARVAARQMLGNTAAERYELMREAC
jgi:hypothetical protein